MQIAQVAHVTAEYAKQHPNSFNQWYDSKYIIVLSVPSLIELKSLRQNLLNEGVLLSDFYEPDINDELTAIAVLPEHYEQAKKYLGHLPLALKKPKGEEIVMSFNKKHNEDQSIPPWMVKTKGKTHYLSHIVSETGFSTKETPLNPHTKGSIKFKGTLTVSENIGYIS